ncbi:hypothetical protein [Methyloglobulus sp.]|uniref:hypothetical protein n=1 Tax=Methyloglobulus sp. TaxID=2518622 RepID=UPI0032B84C07
MSFVAGALAGIVDPVDVLSGVAGLVTIIVADIDPATVAVAAFVNVGSGLVAKNCLETRLAGKLLEALQKQKRSQRTIILLT